MNKLDKSWAEKADYLFQHTWDDNYYSGYIDGASAFQETLLKRIQYELDIASKGNTEQSFVAKICFEGAIEIIKNLKANK